ncbi:MAG: response regulator transcription factor [Candidatus Nanopelagicales bacterium]
MAASTPPGGRRSPDVRVVLVDPAPLFRRGVAQVLAETAGIVLVGEGGDGDALKDLADRARPDVVVMDGRLDGAGSDLCTEVRLRHPSARVVVIVDDVAAAAELAGLVRAGATGVLSRTATAADLVAAISTVADGRTLLSPDMTAQLLDEFALLVRRADGLDSTPGRLTRRELEVLRLVAQGLNNRAIADRLYISENTVKNHVSSIHEKLQVHSRTEAVIRAVRSGLLDIG